MTQNELNEREWKNPRNWKWGIFYSCDRDTRVWVPKRLRWMGWTFNFAHRKSWYWLAVVFSWIIIVIFFVLFKSGK